MGLSGSGTRLQTRQSRKRPERELQNLPGAGEGDDEDLALHRATPYQLFGRPHFAVHAMRGRGDASLDGLWSWNRQQPSVVDMSEISRG